MEHEVKSWPLPFRARRRKQKPWEYRKNDRGYSVGDTLWEREWVPAERKYTGLWVRGSVILDVWSDGPIPEGFCILTMNDDGMFTETVDAEVKACDFCESEGVPLVEYPKSSQFSKWPKEKYRLCDLCANSLLQGSMDYPNQYCEDHRIVDLAKSMYRMGNQILKAVRGNHANRIGE